MRSSSRAFLASALAGFAVDACAGSAPLVPPEQPETKPPSIGSDAPRAIEFNLCYLDAEHFGADRVGMAIGVALAMRTFAAIGVEVKRTGVGPCGPEHADFAGCFGRPGVVACRVDDLGHLHLGAALIQRVTAAAPETVADRRSRTGVGVPIEAVASALQRAAKPRAEWPESAPIEWLAAESGLEAGVVQGFVADVLDGAAAPVSTLAGRPPSLYAGAVPAAAFILGHEVRHALADTCPLTEASVVESNGLWAFVVGAMNSNRLFCPRAVAAEELRADVCGLRAIRAVVESPDFEEQARRASAVEQAADLLGLAMMTRFDATRLGSPIDHFGLDQSDYLPTALRRVVVADELVRAGSARRALCDGAAKSTVVELQKAIQACPGAEGVVEDALLARLPAATETAMSTGAWGRDAFWCPTTP